MATDQVYMARALRLAEMGRYSTQPNPRVGCVIVRDGRIVGEAFHQQAGQAHAEILALQQAGEQARGADVYVTLEPCSHQGRTPPCAEALIRARVGQVVIAMRDPNPLVSGCGIEMLEAQGIRTRTGVCAAEAKQLNRGFIRRMTRGRPFVSLKLATSLDGRIAMQSGESVWITSEAARRDVHRLRLESCAIVTGINTVLKDNPKLTARLQQEDLDPGYSLIGRQPLRLVVGSADRLPNDAAIYRQQGETVSVVATEVADSDPCPGETVTIPGREGGVHLPALLDWLGKREINNLLVETGGTLAASFVRQGLVDELIVYQSPDIMGASAQAMINLPDILKMSEKIKFEYRDLRTIGRDLKLTLTPAS